MHTLVYGQENSTRATIEQVLDERGHQAYTVSGAREAWERYRANKPSMIFLGSAGEEELEFTQRVRLHAGEAPIIVAIESADLETPIQEALAAGIDDCIQAPIDEEHLRRRLAFLERRISRRRDRLRAEKRLTVQHRIAQVLASSDTLEEATPSVLEIICTQLGWEWSELWVPGDDGRELRCVEVWSSSDVTLPDFRSATRQKRFAPGAGLPGAVWAEGEPQWIPNVTQHDNFMRAAEAAEAEMRGAFAFPIQLEGEVWGVMAFLSRQIREPDERLLQAFSVVGNQIGQFAERRWTERELRHSRDRLAQAQEMANLGSWEYNVSSGRMRWSEQMYRLCGEDPSTGEPTYEKVVRLFPPETRQRIADAFEEEGAVDDTTFSGEHRVQRADGKEQWVFARGELVQGPDGTPRRFLGTALDVTPLKQTKQALRESEAKAQAIVETTVDGIITIDEYGHIESFNEAAEEIFGYDKEEVLGRNISVLMPEPYREEHDDYIKRYRETGERHIIGIGREVRGKRKDGSTFPMDLAVSEVSLGDRRIFTGIVRDITERRRLEREVLNAAEQERRRIGQDLHDGLGQMLTGIGLLSQNLAQRLEAQEHPKAAEAKEITELVREADQQARDLAHGLTPVDIEAGGLGAALQRIATNAERLFDIECSVNEMGATVIQNDTTAMHLYRIAQEAVSNAARHGGAEHVTINLASSSDHVRLRVHDNGSGFPEEMDGDGMGVRTMSYRARIIGGTLDITSSPREGATVTCTIPRSTRGRPSRKEDTHQQNTSTHA